MPVEGNPFHHRLAEALCVAPAGHGIEAGVAGIPLDAQVALASDIARRFDAAFGLQPAG